MRVVGIQLLDGVAAGIFGVISVLIASDLMRGTGRFNLAQGLTALSVGIGATLSNATAGYIVQWFGYPAGFLYLAAIAGLRAGVLLAADAGDAGIAAEPAAAARRRTARGGVMAALAASPWSVWGIAAVATAGRHPAARSRGPRPSGPSPARSLLVALRPAAGRRRAGRRSPRAPTSICS